MKRPIALIILLLAYFFGDLMGTIALAASGPAPSPIVATINSQDITLSELDVAAGSALEGVTEPEAQVRIRTQALNGLINQALVDQAISQSNLKDSTDFQRKLNTLQKQLQVNLYIENRAGKLPEVNPKFVEQYYKKNPDFYENRRMYHYAIATIFADGKIDLPEVDKAINVTGFEGLKESLKSRDVSWFNKNYWMGSEQLNPSLLTILKGAGDGQYRAQISPDKKVILVIRNIGSYSDPVTFEEARPVIVKQFNTQIAREIGENILADLRQKAKIQIQDQVLKTQIEKQAILDKAFRPATLLEQLKVSWCFALLVLVPAVLLSFYRSPPPLAVEDVLKMVHLTFKDRLITMLIPRLSYAGDNMEKSLWEVVKEDFILVWQSRYTQFLLMALAAIWFWIPLYELFDQTPSWATLQKLIVLSLAGIGGGVVIGLTGWKVPQIHRLFTNRWVAVAILAVLRGVVPLV